MFTRFGRRTTGGDFSSDHNATGFRVAFIQLPATHNLNHCNSKLNRPPSPGESLDHLGSK